jgi:hypothetical protein
MSRVPGQRSGPGLADGTRAGPARPTGWRWSQTSRWMRVATATSSRVRVLPSRGANATVTARRAPRPSTPAGWPRLQERTARRGRGRLVDPRRGRILFNEWSDRWWHLWSPAHGAAPRAQSDGPGLPGDDAGDARSCHRGAGRADRPRTGSCWKSAARRREIGRSSSWITPRAAAGVERVLLAVEGELALGDPVGVPAKWSSVRWPPRLVIFATSPLRLVRL